MRVRSTTLFSLWIQAKDNDDDDVDDEFADPLDDLDVDIDDAPMD